MALSSLLVVLLAAGLGLLHVFKTWHRHVETQLRLDQCVREAALSLQGTQARIERLNGLIDKGRLALVAGALAPPAQTALRAALETIALAQDADLKRWEIRSLTWATGLGCGGALDLPSALPKLNWSRPPRDPLGPGSLRWTGPPVNRFLLQRRHPPRASAAEVNRDENKKTWMAHWVPAGSKRR